MRIKATIVTYAFSVQCFENGTIVAYAGLRVKDHHVHMKYTQTFMTKHARPEMLTWT